MRYGKLLFLSAAASVASGWTLLGELPDYEGYPISMELDSIGSTAVVLMEQEISDVCYRYEVIVGIDGDFHCSIGDPYPSPLTEVRPFVLSPLSEEDCFDYSLPIGISHLSASGDTLWATALDTLSGDEIEILRILPSLDGGCYAVLGPSPGSDLWNLYRLDESGNLLMSNQFQLQGGPVLGLSDMVETRGSGILLTGVTDSLGMSLYMFLLGFDQDGRDRMRILEGFRFHASGDIIRLDERGSIYVAGHTGYERDDGYFMPPVQSDVFIMKLDSLGKEEWRTVFVQPLENVPRFMDISGDGEVVILARSHLEDGSDPDAPLYSLLLYSP
ncbi:MAG: hypothetical protein JXA64_00220 [Candidatus Fermentibacteraceae bacterium]|nr:hypothetical protein [Candidatus Fermentibacteraceae bacterium]MBN2607509.1 hypothetical protein [Candidatus Fermentibacteraceae bacterium]